VFFNSFLLFFFLFFFFCFFFPLFFFFFFFFFFFPFLHPFACYLRTRILHNLDETGLEAIAKRGRDKGKMRRRKRERERDEAVKSKWQERGQRGEVGCKRLEKQRRERAPKRVEDRFTQRRVLSLQLGLVERKRKQKRKKKKRKRGRQRENRKKTNGRKREKRVSWEEKGRTFA